MTFQIQVYYSQLQKIEVLYAKWPMAFHNFQMDLKDSHSHIKEQQIDRRQNTSVANQQFYLSSTDWKFSLPALLSSFCLRKGSIDRYCA